LKKSGFSTLNKSITFGIPTLKGILVNTNLSLSSVLRTTLLRKREVLKRTGLSNTSLYQLIQDKKFPAQVLLVPGGRAVAWNSEEITAWIDGRIKASQKA
jgi:prophage regulatory protein